MNEPIYATGKKVDDAIKEALKELAQKTGKEISLDDVSVEILNEGGLFSKAKVKITLDESFIKAQTKPEPAKVEPVKPAVVKVEPIRQQSEKVELTNKEQRRVEPAKKSDIKKEIAKETKKEEVKLQQGKKQEPKQREERKEEYEKLVLIKEDKYPVSVFIRKLADEFDEKDAKISCEENSRELMIKITGENMGKFIGNGGETLSAIQTLANVVSGQNRETNKRVYIDAGNYKGSKNDKLKDVAKRFAEEVLESCESRKLKPMNPYERRIVHAYVSEEFDLKTKSVGEEPYRCVVILPKR